MKNITKNFFTTLAGNASHNGLSGPLRLVYNNNNNTTVANGKEL